MYKQYIVMYKDGYFNSSILKSDIIDLLDIDEEWDVIDFIPISFTKSYNVLYKTITEVETPTVLVAIDLNIPYNVKALCDKHHESFDFLEL